MAKVVPIDQVKALHGKVKSHGDMMFVTNSLSGDINTRMIGKRNKEAHPVTEREVTTHNKMHDATAAYHELKQNLEAYRAFLEQYQEAKAKGCTCDKYRYFLKQYLDEGKNTVTIKIANKGSNEESYVRGMERCQTIEEADRLLVKFVEVLGYKKLAEAYKRVGK